MDLGDLRRGLGGGVHALARLRRVQARARARSGGRPRRDPLGTGGHGSGHHEPGPGEHPEPCGRLRGRRARHLPVGEHDRDPDPGSVEQHRAATEHGHLLHRGPRREQLRVLAGPVRRPSRRSRGSPSGRRPPRSACWTRAEPSSSATPRNRRRIPRRAGSPRLRSRARRHRRARRRRRRPRPRGRLRRPSDPRPARRSIA